ncbi:MAG: hypothetical protein ACFNL5_05515, partial [Rothia dentocariosa]
MSGTQVIKVDGDFVLEVQRVRERIHYADARERELPGGAHTSQPARIPAQALALQTWNTCAQQSRALVVGSSSIVRDLDIIAPALGADAPARVLANRGLSGIDGLIATAVGVSLAGYYPTGNARTAVDASAHVAGAPIPVTLICGDLTFQYDI